MKSYSLFFICFLTNYLLVGQNKQELIYQENREESIVKAIPFENLNVPEGLDYVIKVSKNPIDHHQILVAFETAGILYSDNSGVNFIPITKPSEVLSIKAMEVHWQSQSIWIIGDDKIFLSQDLGKNWQSITTPETYHINNIYLLSDNEILITSKGNKDILGGIFKSSNQGKSWQQTFSGSFIDTIEWSNSFKKMGLLTTFNDDEQTTKSEIYKTTDGGNSWQIISNKQTFALKRGKISFAIYSENSIFALVDNQTPIENDSTIINFENLINQNHEKLTKFIYQHHLQDKISPENLRQFIKENNRTITYSDLILHLDGSPLYIGAELYHSKDGGYTWEKINTNLKDIFLYNAPKVSKLAVNPNNEKELYLSGIALLRSEDAGLSWQVIKDFPIDNQVYQLSIKKDELLYATNRGVFESVDKGNHWKKYPLQLSSQIRSMALTVNQPQKLLVSLDHFGVWEYHKNWKKISSKEGQIVTNENIYVMQNYGSLFNLSDSSYICSPYKKEYNRFAKNTPLHVSALNSSIFYTGHQQIFQSFNQGKSWINISENLTNSIDKKSTESISAISESPLEFGLLYVGSSDGMIHMSKNRGDFWQLIYSSFPQKNYVSQLLSSHYKKSRVYAILKNSLNTALFFKSENFGKTWENLQANLPNQTINTIVEDPNNSQTLYIGTQNGVYVSFDLGEYWHLFVNQIPRTNVTHLAIDKNSQILYAGTQSQGVFRANISPLKKMKAALLDQKFYPIETQYQVKYSTLWGDKLYQWQKENEPKLQLSAYCSVPSIVKIQISHKNIPLFETVFSSQKGFNIITIPLEISKNITYFVSENPNLVPASNSKYYLTKGQYKLTFEVEDSQEERILTIN